MTPRRSICVAAIWCESRMRFPNGGMNLLSRQVLKINAKLLALLVEVASFEPQRFCRLRDLTAVPFKLSKHGGALEGLHPFCERTGGSAASRECDRGGICG